MSTRATLAEDFWDRPLRDLFQTLEASPAGLTSDEANRRLRLYNILLSVLLNFSMEFQARHAVEKIRKQVATTAAVIRDVQEQELLIAELVPGDIIRLSAGDLVPADARLLKLTDLHVRESALTGESLPVDKSADDLPLGKHGIADASNSVFLGTAVQTEIGTAVIVRTGRDTAFGRIAQRLAMRPPETEFARGIRHFGMIITWITTRYFDRDDRAF